MKITIKSINSAKYTNLIIDSINENTTISEISNIVLLHDNNPINEQLYMIFRGKILSDMSATLKSLGINDGDSLVRYYKISNKKEPIQQPPNNENVVNTSNESNDDEPTININDNSTQISLNLTGSNRTEIVNSLINAIRNFATVEYENNDNNEDSDDVEHIYTEEEKNDIKYLINLGYTQEQVLNCYNESDCDRDAAEKLLIEKYKKNKKNDKEDDDIKTIINMGFDEHRARQAYTICGNLENAINFLLSD